MRRKIRIWALGGLTLSYIITGMNTTFLHARELDQETYHMLSYGMTESGVVGRTGQPDRRIDQFEPTPLSQRLISYQYIWGGDTSRGEWTTTVTFSSNTNKVIRIERERR
ncbi:MAG: hypothetical protein KF693_12865 [Nitrospira sp.]|nr:hypothetical protein [Nitrospira sp.]